MGRKLLNRKELREENEAAERGESGQKPEQKKTPRRSTTKAGTRKSRTKANKEVRLKAFWGVYNQSLNAIDLFEYSQRKEAEKRAQELSESRKSPHFVQLVKKVIEE